MASVLSFTTSYFLIKKDSGQYSRVVLRTKQVNVFPTVRARVGVSPVMPDTALDWKGRGRSLDSC